MPVPRFSRGRPLPLGTTQYGDGVNFSLLCRHGNRVWLVLSPPDETRAFRRVGGWTPTTIGPVTTGISSFRTCRRFFGTGGAWTSPPGPYTRYDPSVVLLDPAATLVAGGGAWGSQCDVDRKAVGPPRPLQPRPAATIGKPTRRR